MGLINRLKVLAWVGLILASFVWLTMPEYRAVTKLGQYDKALAGKFWIGSAVLLVGCWIAEYTIKMRKK